MDLIDLLPQLEAIARQINFQPLDDLLAQIRQIVDRLLLNILPHEPVRDGGAALEGYASRLDDLRGQIASGIAGLQGIYAGPGADTYYASVTDALGQITRTRDHLNTSAHHHYDLADHALEAAVQQGILIGQAGLMAFDLGSLVFTAGVDAPVSVPVAAGDAVAAVGTTAALDGAVDAAEVTVGVIGESAADLGTEAADLGAEGAEGLDAAADVSGDAAADAGGPGDVGGGGGGDEPPPGGGSGGGDQPPGDGSGGTPGDSGDGGGSDGGGSGGSGKKLPATTEESVADKLDKYLLNPDHPVGGTKANWFQRALGFTRDNADELANQIVFDDSSAVETGVTQFGTKYNQVISIVGANGKVIDVTFAWIKNLDGVVRLVTAIPN